MDKLAKNIHLLGRAAVEVVEEVSSAIPEISRSDCDAAELTPECLPGCQLPSSRIRMDALYLGSVPSPLHRAAR